MATNEGLHRYDLSPGLEPLPGSSRIHQIPQPKTSPPAKPYVAPIDRRDLDRIRPWFYLLLAGAFFILSLVSTVAQVGELLSIGGVHLVPWQVIVAGLVVAGILTAGELMTGEGMVYFCFLVPDVILTVWWLWPVLLRWSTAAGAGAWGAAIGGMALGIFSAWLPERIILGQRRHNNGGVHE